MASKSTGTNANSAVVQMQKIAADTQIKLQQMTDASTAKTFAFNEKEAKVSRDWQTEMSNTSHQREVKDLVKAGLNPVLSAGGNGAQSYTTSSASGQADNPASAVAAMQASRMSGIANIESSNISAAATKAAAAASAKAMQRAAATQAAAQRYAAAMNYEASKYRSDMSYKETKYAWDSKMNQLKYQIEHTPVSNKWSLLDKYLDQTGIRGNAVNSIKSVVSKVIDNPNKYLNTFTSGLTKVTSLTNPGNKLMSHVFKQLGMPASQQNIQLFINGYIKGDKTSLSKFKTLYRRYHYDSSQLRHFY